MAGLIAATPELADYAFVYGQTAYTAGGLATVGREIYHRLKGRSMTTRSQAAKGRTLFPTHSQLRAKRQKTVMVSPPTAAPTAAPTIHHTAVNPRRTAYYRTLGRRKGKFATRRAAVLDQIDTVPPDKQIYANGMVFINKASSTEEDIIHKRRGDLAYVHGVKWRHIFKLTQVDTPGFDITKPIRVRWAVVIPKGDSIPSGNATLLDFFIDPNPDQDQIQPGPFGSGSHFALFNRKINREAYSVLREGQFLLSQQGQPESFPAMFGPSSTKIISTYIPIKRQMKFNEDGTPEKDISFLYWYADDCDVGTTQKWPVNRPIQAAHEKITYFTNAVMFK